MGKKKPSLHFVEAINIELTYQCNLTCSHCLQHEVRQQSDLTWVNTNSAINCLTEAKALGLVDSGVNFTGGEPFLRGSNLPGLLKASKCLGLGVRVNTNGWWGNHKDITIGSERFSSCREVVKWLKQQNVALLALSFDQRYETNSMLFNSVLHVMRECEAQGLHYQLIHTHLPQSMNSHLWERLWQETDNQFGYMIPVEMEMVDLGAAAGLKDVGVDSQMYCEGKGFYRPRFLHINPHGGVRSCMYAAGVSWLGNINHESLYEIVDKFSYNPVVEFFSSNGASRSNLVEKIFSGKDVPKHPCSLAVKLASFIELSKQNINTFNEVK